MEKIQMKNNLIITKVNCIGKFDQGSLPELDNVFTSLAPQSKFLKGMGIINN